jgi:hypothetical protein
MSYRVLLQNKAEFESKICGMHANIAQAVREHNRQEDRDPHFFDVLVENIVNMLHKNVDKKLSVGIMFSSPFANYYSEADFDNNDVIVNLLIDNIDIDSKMMTFIRKSGSVDSSENSPIWSALYRYDCTK